MKDELGNRIKEDYENRTRYYLPRRTYTLARIDGKTFKTYTKGLKRPFDMDLIEDMDTTAQYLCKNIQGAKFAFVQSDEISILLTDFEAIGTDAWFDGNIQKMASISASMATAKFNQLRMIRILSQNVGFDFNKIKLAEFDSRVFTIASKEEVMNYFNFRQKDTIRNSISSVAQSLYSHKELNGKNCSEQQEMIFQKGTNWNDLDPKLKRGRFIEKINVEKEADPNILNSVATIRSMWVSNECPTFTQEREFLISRIPNLL